MDNVKECYQTDNAGVFIGVVFAPANPEEEGKFLVPYGAYEDAPPAVAEHQVARRVAPEYTSWEIVPDYRGVTYWLADRTKHTITEAGEAPPAGYLAEDPGPPLDEQKAVKLLILNDKVTATITAGFVCDALEEGMLYPTDDASQTNLQARVTESLVRAAETGVAYKILCKNAEGVWERRPHTAAQIQEVGMAAIDHVQQALDLKDTKAAAINAATTKEELDAIVW